MGKNLKRTSLFLLLCVFALCGETLFAQPHQHVEVHPVLAAIQKDVESGQISKNEALLQSVYAGYAPERLNLRFRTESETNPLIRCMTPVLIEYENAKDQLSGATISEIESLISTNASAASQSHISPSGNFILHYEVEGEDAVPLEDSDGNGIPDYIEKAAFAADSSYRHEVENIGFMDFLKSDPYEIYFLDFGFYGTTRSSGSTTVINIHSNFDGFPKNTHPEGNQIGALYATMAHEIKHAIQHATNRRWYNDYRQISWIEMDATLMEEIVFDDVNDYYNYIMQYDNNLEDWDRGKASSSSIFGRPEDPIPGSYNHITWMLYFAESIGMEFWVDVWDVIRADYLNTQNSENLIPFLDAMEQVLNQDGKNLRNEHIKNHLWHIIAGPDLEVSDFGFEEGSKYPNSKFGESVYLAPNDSISINLQELSPQAATYIDVSSSTLSLGQPKFNLQATQKNIGFGVVAVFQDGSSDYLISLDPSLTDQSVQSTWYWKDLKQLRVAVIDIGDIGESLNTENFSSDNRFNLNLKISSVIPDNDLIAQNYPNPFNPATTIKFALTERKDVKVEVYDRIGRKISTLVDAQLGRGFHTVQFDGSGLASGVYFYRITTDQAAIIRKMVLVK